MFDFLAYWQFWIVAVGVGSFCVVMFFYAAAEARRDGERTPWTETATVEDDASPLGRLIVFPTPVSHGLWMTDGEMPEFGPVIDAVSRGWVRGASASDLMRSRGRD